MQSRRRRRPPTKSHLVDGSAVGKVEGRDVGVWVGAAEGTDVGERLIGRGKVGKRVDGGFA